MVTPVTCYVTVIPYCQPAVSLANVHTSYQIHASFRCRPCFVLHTDKVNCGFDSIYWRKYYLSPAQTSLFLCAEYNSRIICMRSATSETIKFGRFESCAACVAYSTAPVEYSAKVQLVFQTSNFSCVEYNAQIMFVYTVPSNRFFLAALLTQLPCAESQALCATLASKLRNIRLDCSKHYCIAFFIV